MILDDSILKTDLFSPVCSGCRHLNLDIARGRVSCAAFDQIPPQIWSGENDHTAPVAGDKGILFSPIQ